MISAESARNMSLEALIQGGEKYPYNVFLKSVEESIKQAAVKGNFSEYFLIPKYLKQEEFELCIKYLKLIKKFTIERSDESSFVLYW